MADDPNTETKQPEAKPEPKRAYAVLRPVKHDGKLHLPATDGSVQVKLTEAEAAELKALGAVGDPPPKAKG